MKDYKIFTRNSSVEMQNNVDAMNVFDFLCEPESINSMIVATKLGLPAIAGVAKEIEQKFGNATNFPMNNDTNRQTVGRMIKFILEQFAYDPIPDSHNKKGQLKSFLKTEYFSSGSIYEKMDYPATYSIKVDIV